jgi:hypothetical protein
MYRIVPKEMQTPNVIVPSFEASKIASIAHISQLVIIRSGKIGARISMIIADLGQRERNKEYDHFLLRYNNIQAGSSDDERIGDQCCRLGKPARVEKFKMSISHLRLLLESALLCYSSNISNKNAIML